MDRTVKITAQKVVVTEFGTEPTVPATGPSAGNPYVTMLTKDTTVPVGGSVGFVIPPSAKGGSTVIQSQEAGASRDFTLNIANSVPKDISLKLVPNADGRIVLMMEANFGADPVTVTYTDDDATHAQPTKLHAEWWA